MEQRDRERLLDSRTEAQPCLAQTRWWAGPPPPCMLPSDGTESGHGLCCGCPPPRVVGHRASLAASGADEEACSTTDEDSVWEVAEAPWSVAEWVVALRFDNPRATVLVPLLG